MKKEAIRRASEKAILEGDSKGMIGEYELRKVTAASFALAELCKLSIMDETSPTGQFDILGFLWIHTRAAREAREAIFDNSEGVDSVGRSLAFVSAVLDWADEIDFKDYTAAAQRINEMLEESFAGVVEPLEEDDGAKKKKGAAKTR